MTSLPTPDDALAYATDAGQRAVLFMDVMRQRSEQAAAHNAETVPHVLSFDADLVCDGRNLPRPVNYLLVRIQPPGSVVIDPIKRPFVVVDPRAGHGPGIGGFKADSEIGVALKAGHPCYFVGFLPDPVPDQTIEDIAMAEAAFLEWVIALHPDAEGKPCVIGNCQAGWAVMILASLRPELFGPIIIAGSPLSYWAGVEGQYPMRYSGGLLGGSWLTALTGDLGAGVFDGAWLVTNFENQNPANTLWSKQYNLYSKIDTEAERYLGFEKWWGGHVSLNAAEMQFIVDELFVGNKLAAGQITTSDGTAVDLRNIRSPIVVFCSKGDNITPPQQALGWILDLYDSIEEIRAHGQTIVYTIHETIGHLGIFVSAGVARKEHDEFASNIDLIDVLPPGLYEAVLTPRGSDAMAQGDWVMRCETRTLEDIRALGGNTVEEERMFEAAARVSEVNLALYRTFAQPFVKAVVTPEVAQVLKALHPLRIQYDLFGPNNPFMGWVGAAAENARADRRPMSVDNPFLALQEKISNAVVEGLEGYRKAIERISEDSFRRIYGNEAFQKALGLDTTSDQRPRRAAKSLLHRELTEQRIASLRTAMATGGLREAGIRALLYVGRPRGAVDERGFEAIRRLRRNDAALSLHEFKATVRQQFLMLVIDEEAAIAALPGLLPPDEAKRLAVLDMLRGVLAAGPPLDGESARRLERVTEIFAPPTASAPRRAVAAAKTA
ncbi:DUF3141 domain-containing protein [Mesorhizobium sophorae]|uniref:DUF3141 domain-containing protein n=1 Tax=Mesorhizobium sophorae TaxID=1300294 RepID=UPI000BA34EA8|nr:DUF3141 domain-containing protein [Mesorhizobium sophorae]